MLPLRMLGVVLLMFSLCDADSACPEELNPLSLNPPEIIEEYGTQVMVNCTSTAPDHDGMYWRVENKSFSIEEGEYFVAQSVLLSDWNVTAECKIKLNESHECSKELEMTIYKNPEVISSIKFVHATPRETQYELTCDAINVAPVQNLTVRWYKNDELTEIKSFNDTTKTPVNESSVLTVSISRGEGEVQIRCEAQLDLRPHGPQLTVISQTHNVTAQYAPELNPKDDEYLVTHKDENITLNCEAEGNPPPVFHWSYDGVTISESSNSLTINQLNVSTTYACTASNFLGNITKKIHVRVIQKEAAPAAPPTSEAATPGAKECPITLTPSEVVVRFGDPVSVNCSTSSTDALGMGWEGPVGGTGSEKPPVVTWMVEKLEDWTKPFCYVSPKTDSFKQCYKYLAITLYKTPDTVSVSAVHPGPMVEGTDYILKCGISNVAPVGKLQVKWYRDDKTVKTQTFNNTSVKSQDVISHLIITPEREYNGSLFRCEAELHLGPNGPDFIPTESSAPYTAVVHYKPFFKACPSSYSAVEHKFSMDMLPCPAEGNPPPTVQWYHQGEPINSSEPFTRSDTGEYTAEVVNHLGGSNTSVEIIVEYEPAFDCKEHYEVEVNAVFLTKCKPEGKPAPIVQWFKGEEVMPLSYRWTKHDSGEYLLKATNKHGKAEHTVHLDVLYAPEFKEGNSNKEVGLGENVTLDCSAEGNPPPVIHWNFSSAANLNETTVGRQKIITVTGATSTNAGVYHCVATNKVGSLSRSVTLVMKGKTSGVPMEVIVVLLIVLAIAILLIVMVFFLNRHKKHGQYSFVPDNGKNGSNGHNIPMSDVGTA